MLKHSPFNPTPWIGVQGDSVSMFQAFEATKHNSTKYNPLKEDIENVLGKDDPLLYESTINEISYTTKSGVTSSPPKKYAPITQSYWMFSVLSDSLAQCWREPRPKNGHDPILADVASELSYGLFNKVTSPGERVMDNYNREWIWTTTEINNRNTVCLQNDINYSTTPSDATHRNYFSMTELLHDLGIGWHVASSPYSVRSILPPLPASHLDFYDIKVPIYNINPLAMTSIVTMQMKKQLSYTAVPGSPKGVLLDYYVDATGKENTNGKFADLAKKLWPKSDDLDLSSKQNFENAKVAWMVMVRSFFADDSVPLGNHFPFYPVSNYTFIEKRKQASDTMNVGHLPIFVDMSRAEGKAITNTDPTELQMRAFKWKEFDEIRPILKLLIQELALSCGKTLSKNQSKQNAIINNFKLYWSAIIQQLSRPLPSSNAVEWLPEARHLRSILTGRRMEEIWITERIEDCNNGSQPWVIQAEITHTDGITPWIPVPMDAAYLNPSIVASGSGDPSANKRLQGSKELMDVAWSMAEDGNVRGYGNMGNSAAFKVHPASIIQKKLLLKQANGATIGGIRDAEFITNMYEATTKWKQQAPFSYDESLGSSPLTWNLIKYLISEWQPQPDPHIISKEFHPHPAMADGLLVLSSDNNIAADLRDPTIMSSKTLPLPDDGDTVNQQPDLVNETIVKGRNSGDAYGQLPEFSFNNPQTLLPYNQVIPLVSTGLNSQLFSTLLPGSVRSWRRNIIKKWLQEWYHFVVSGHIQDFLDEQNYNNSATSDRSRKQLPMWRSLAYFLSKEVDWEQLKIDNDRPIRVFFDRLLHGWDNNEDFVPCSDYAGLLFSLGVEETKVATAYPKNVAINLPHQKKPKMDYVKKEWVFKDPVVQFIMSDRYIDQNIPVCQEEIRVYMLWLLQMELTVQRMRVAMGQAWNEAINYPHRIKRLKSDIYQVITNLSIHPVDISWVIHGFLLHSGCIPNYTDRELVDDALTTTYGNWIENNYPQYKTNQPPPSSSFITRIASSSATSGVSATTNRRTVAELLKLTQVFSTPMMEQSYIDMGIPDIVATLLDRIWKSPNNMTHPWFRTMMLEDYNYKEQRINMAPLAVPLPLRLILDHPQYSPLRQTLTINMHRIVAATNSPAPAGMATSLINVKRWCQEMRDQSSWYYMTQLGHSNLNIRLDWLRRCSPSLSAISYCMAKYGYTGQHDQWFTIVDPTTGSLIANSVIASDRMDGPRVWINPAFIEKQINYLNRHSVIHKENLRTGLFKKELTNWLFNWDDFHPDMNMKLTMSFVIPSKAQWYRVLWQICGTTLVTGAVTAIDKLAPESDPVWFSDSIIIRQIRYDNTDQPDGFWTQITPGPTTVKLPVQTITLPSYMAAFGGTYSSQTNTMFSEDGSSFVVGSSKDRKKFEERSMTPVTTQFHIAHVTAMVEFGVFKQTTEDESTLSVDNGLSKLLVPSSSDFRICAKKRPDRFNCETYVNNPMKLLALRSNMPLNLPGIHPHTGTMMDYMSVARGVMSSPNTEESTSWAKWLMTKQLEMGTDGATITKNLIPVGFYKITSSNDPLSVRSVLPQSRLLLPDSSKSFIAGQDDKYTSRYRSSDWDEELERKNGTGSLPPTPPNNSQPPLFSDPLDLVLVSVVIV